eukprot:1340515-Rhodomonas_salina.1
MLLRVAPYPSNYAPTPISYPKQLCSYAYPHAQKQCTPMPALTCRAWCAHSRTRLCTAVPISVPHFRMLCPFPYLTWGHAVPGGGGRAGGHRERNAERGHTAGPIRTPTKGL